MSYVIVFEGCGDGVGKSTQAKMLKDYLIEKGLSVDLIHFPSDNNDIKDFLVGKIKGLNHYQVYMLYVYDRLIKYIKEIRYSKSDVIIFDRYLGSSLIYQTIGLDKEETNKFIDFVIDLEYNKLKLPKADKVYFLNADINDINHLLDNRDEEKDIFEEDNEFRKKVSEKSKYIAKLRNWTNIDITKDNEVLTAKQVFNKIKSDIDNIF